MSSGLLIALLPVVILRQPQYQIFRQHQHVVLGRKLVEDRLELPGPLMTFCACAQSVSTREGCAGEFPALAPNWTAQPSMATRCRARRADLLDQSGFLAQLLGRKHSDRDLALGTRTVVGRTPGSVASSPVLLTWPAQRSGRRGNARNECQRGDRRRRQDCNEMFLGTEVKHY